MKEFIKRLAGLFIIAFVGTPLILSHFIIWLIRGRGLKITDKLMDWVDTKLLEA